jgi:hypothetical protein
MDPFTYYFLKVLNLLIIIPVIISIVRFNKINPVFRPFAYLLWGGCLNEVFSGVVIQMGYYNTVNFNIWLLLEAYILIWLFKEWRLPVSSKKLYNSMFFIYSIAWLLETIFISKLTLGFNSYFRILYSFITVLMSISLINFLLLKERNLLRNPMFIISCAFILFYTITSVAEAFYAYGLHFPGKGDIYMSVVITVTNFVCNLIFVLAILWMPKRQAFSLQY